VVFGENDEGDVAPKRKLDVTHRAYALAVDESKQELFVSVQYPPQVEVYRKTASGAEKPLRVLSGESTRLSDSHGIAVDEKNKLLFVNNWGNISDPLIPGTGRFDLPSISVYPLDASGDTSPLRVIQGPKTQLNWPGTMSLDPETGDLYVANDVGHSILVFRGTDSGDVAPSRVIRGNRTGLSSPVGVFVDGKNKELWVSNLGNASATVYPLTANGNAAPLRTIRSAPEGKVSLKFGKTQAVAYDSSREQILVPN
jgi:6-phosphogluconolactonase (cycloisomerase 2 family)